MVYVLLIPLKTPGASFHCTLKIHQCLPPTLSLIWFLIIILIITSGRDAGKNCIQLIQDKEAANGWQTQSAVKGHENLQGQCWEVAVRTQEWDMAGANSESRPSPGFGSGGAAKDLDGRMGPLCWDRLFGWASLSGVSGEGVTGGSFSAGPVACSYRLSLTPDTTSHARPISGSWL